MKIKVLDTVKLDSVKPYHIKHGIDVGDFYEVLDVKDDFYGVMSGYANECNETGLWYLHKNDVEVLEDVSPETTEQSTDLKVGDIVEIVDNSMFNLFTPFVENGIFAKNGDKGKIVSFNENDSDRVLLDIFENTKQYIHKKHLQKVKDTPSMFILMNDAGLSLDKVNSCLDILRAEDGLDLDELDIVDELLVETLSHLRQLMNNLEKL